MCGTWVLCLVLFTIRPAQADSEPVYQIDLPAQAVADALTALSEQTGVAVIFPYDLARRRNANSVVGSYTLLQALAELLAGTGLSGGLSDKGVMTISPAGSAMPNQLRNTVKQFDQKSIATRSGASSVFAGITALLGSLAALTARSEEGELQSGGAFLEEVVVTAEKRAESMQRLPIAISAFSSEVLEQRGVVNVEDLQRLAPSLQVGTKQFGFQRIYIRGVGSSSFGDPTVSIVQDGVPMWGAYFDFDIFDTERVEVLRGPQGTVSGRNATAGTINVVSRRPTEQFDGGVKFTLGNYSYAAGEAHLSGPVVSDRLLGRVAVRSTHAGGYVTNYVNGQELGAISRIDARGTLLGELTDDVEAVLSWEHHSDRSNPFYVVNDGPVRLDLPSFNEVNQLRQFEWDRKGPFGSDINAQNDSTRDLAVLRLDWNLGSQAHLAATTGYSRRDIKYVADFEGTEVPVVTFDPATQVHPKVWQRSQELTLTADLTDRLDLILGGLYLSGELDRSFNLGIPYLGVPNYALHERTSDEIDSWAGYTQWRYRFTDALRVTAGVRYTRDSVTRVTGTYVGSTPIVPVKDEARYSAWTPRLAIDYMPTADLTLYANASRGYKAGGFNAPRTEFEPEYVWNYEGGVKANWLNARLSTRLAAFYMKYANLQQTIQEVDPARGVVQRIIGGDATIGGLELDLEAAITEHFRASLSGTWLPTAKYGDDLRSIDSQFPELGVRDLSGNRLIQAPKYQFNVSGEYTRPLGPEWQAVFTASYARQGRKFFDFYNHPFMEQQAYGVLNLQAILETTDGDWQVTAYANNATDTFYRTDKLAATTIYTTAWVGLPRMYGVSLAHLF